MRKQLGSRVVIALLAAALAGCDLPTADPGAPAFATAAADSVIGVNPGTLHLTLVRMVSGPATATQALAGARPSFVADGSGGAGVRPAGLQAAARAIGTNTVSAPVRLDNLGALPLSWRASSNQPWLRVGPSEGVLAPGAATQLTVETDGTLWESVILAPGTHQAHLTIADSAAGAARQIPVTLRLVNAELLTPDTPRLLSSGYGGEKYYVVQVPAGLARLTLRIEGDNGDADIYVQHGALPVPYDYYEPPYGCVPYTGGSTEVCEFDPPWTGTYYVLIHAYRAYSGVTLSMAYGGPPAAPRTPVATATSGTSARLAWRDGSVNEDSVSVWRRTLAGGTWGAWSRAGVRPANDTTFMDTALSPATGVQYRLRACNAEGCSAWVTSNVLTLPVIPAAPAVVSGTVLSAASLRVRWSNVTGETSWQVQRAGVTGGVADTFVDVAAPAADQVAWNDAGLTTGSTYRYRVRACNVAGCSAWTTGPDLAIPPIPAAPAGVVAHVRTSTRILLAWTDGAHETSYVVQRALRNPDGTWPAFSTAATLPAGSTSFNNTGLLPGRTYRYQVRACNLSGCSAWVMAGPVTTLGS